MLLLVHMLLLLRLLLLLLLLLRIIPIERLRAIRRRHRRRVLLPTTSIAQPASTTIRRGRHRQIHGVKRRGRLGVERRRRPAAERRLAEDAPTTTSSSSADAARVGRRVEVHVQHELLVQPAVRRAARLWPRTPRRHYFPWGIPPRRRAPRGARADYSWSTPARDELLLYAAYGWYPPPRAARPIPTITSYTPQAPRSATRASRRPPGPPRR